jgi:hypothetical protein
LRGSTRANGRRAARAPPPTPAPTPHIATPPTPRAPRAGIDNQPRKLPTGAEESICTPRCYLDQTSIAVHLPGAHAGAILAHTESTGLELGRTWSAPSSSPSLENVIAYAGSCGGNGGALPLNAAASAASSASVRYVSRLCVQRSNMPVPTRSPTQGPSISSLIMLNTCHL